MLATLQTNSSGIPKALVTREKGIPHDTELKVPATRATCWTSGLTEQGIGNPAGHAAENEQLPNRSHRSAPHKITARDHSRLHRWIEIRCGRFTY